jgi:hypothetical protein
MMIIKTIPVDTIHWHFTRIIVDLENRRRAILLVIDVVNNYSLIRRDSVTILTIITVAQEVLIAALMVLVLTRTLLKEGAAADSEVRTVNGKRVKRHSYEVQQMKSFINLASFFTNLVKKMKTNIIKYQKCHMIYEMIC